MRDDERMIADTPVARPRDESSDWPATPLQDVASIPVFSLYGEVRKPTDTMMNAFDVILVDLQDHHPANTECAIKKMKGPGCATGLAPTSAHGSVG